MKSIKYIAYRYITNDEFFCMYKQTDAEQGGGGQKYIDFPTGKIPVKNWESFFDGVIGLESSKVTNGPKWEFPIHSIGVKESEKQSLPILSSTL